MTITLSTEMVRLAGEGAMFNIARLEKQFRYTSRSTARFFESLRKSGRIDNPNSEAPLTGRSGQLMFQADSLLVQEESRARS